MPTTIRDVALCAGVSPMTVSRVLNDEPFVRDEMRAKVLRAIEQLGYVPNLSAKRLAKGRSLAIALLYHNASWHYIQDVLRGALDMARAAGYTTLMHPCDLMQPTDACGIVEMALQRQVDGFIFTAPADNARSLLEDLDRMGIPFVRLTPSDRESAWPYVTATDRAGACQMTRYLLDLGHRRIGYVLGLQATRAAHDRFAGYRDALAEAGVGYDETLVRPGNDLFDAGRDAAHSLLQIPSRPTAIFCSNDEMAAGVCVALHETGLHMPADVSVAGFDDIALGPPDLAAIDHGPPADLRNRDDRHPALNRSLGASPAREPSSRDPNQPGDP